MRNLSKGVIRKIKTFFLLSELKYDRTKYLADAHAQHAKFNIELN